VKKLYNLYKEVILEATELGDVQRAMNNHVMVRFNYDGKPRYGGIYAIGTTNKGHSAIRFYEPNSKSKSKVQWKTLILNKIKDFEVLKMKIYSPPDELFNVNGDKTLNIKNGSGGNVVSFDDKYMDNYRTRHSNWQSNLDTKQQNEPLNRNRVDNTDSANNAINYNKTNADYEYTPYEKPITNKDDNQTRYQDDTETQDDAETQYRYQDNVKI